MTTKLAITCYNAQQAHVEMMGRVWPLLKSMCMAGHKMILSIRPETRSEAQNRLMWPLLTVFSQQLQWPVDGRMVTMDPDDWKDILSAAFKGESVRLAMGLNGGVVLLGQRTSKFTKAQFSEWIEFLYATAADRGVKLPAWDYESGEAIPQMKVSHE